MGFELSGEYRAWEQPGAKRFAFKTEAVEVCGVVVRHRMAVCGHVLAAGMAISCFEGSEKQLRRFPL